MIQYYVIPEENISELISTLQDVTQRLEVCALAGGNDPDCVAAMLAPAQKVLAKAKKLPIREMTEIDTVLHAYVQALTEERDALRASLDRSNTDRQLAERDAARWEQRAREAEGTLQRDRQDARRAVSMLLERAMSVNEAYLRTIGRLPFDDDELPF